MLIPSASASVWNTVYSNSSDVVPEPLTYSAFRKLDPIPSRTRGLFAPVVGVTVTAALNSTVTTTTSLNSNVLSAGASPIDTPVTPGGPRLPSTLCAAAFVIAWLPRPRFATAVPPAIRTVPPFSANALAPMLTPVESLSVAATV